MTVATEADLYPLVEQYLNLVFAPTLKPSLGAHLHLVAITATAGPASSGKWSRPDLALVNLWRHKYQPHQSLDLYGFEVKRDGACDLSAVHETLAHTRLVQYAYLVWHFRQADFECTNFLSIRENCAAYRLGLITFSDPSRGATFKVHLDSGHHSPDLAAVDEFIETRFPDHQKDRLLTWIAEPPR